MSNFSVYLKILVFLFVFLFFWRFFTDEVKVYDVSGEEEPKCLANNKRERGVYRDPKRPMKRGHRKWFPETTVEKLK